MEKNIRFKFSPKKARAAIQWMLQQQNGIDLHTVLKACYFADKAHLNKYGRPIFGARYRAMKFGPVPVEIYEMAKGEPYWLPELGINRYPWFLDGYQLCVADNANPHFGSLSETDFEELQQGFAYSCSMNFNERTSATHGPDWQAADLGFMRYEDMIYESENKNEMVRYLKENAKRIKI